MTERRTVVVIGGGAAGLMAAATAAEFSDPAETRVLLVEQNDRMGKKLRTPFLNKYLVRYSVTLRRFFDFLRRKVKLCEDV